MKTRYIYIFLLSWLPFFASAQQALTLDECRNMALQNNKKIDLAEATLQKASYDVRMYRANFLPKISASGIGYYTNSTIDMAVKVPDISLFDLSTLSGYLPSEWLQSLTDLTTVQIPDIGLDLKLNNSYMAGINLQQPVFMGGKIVSAYKMSKIGKEMANLNVAMTESEVIAKTDEAYWLHIQLIELQKTAVKYKEVVEELYRNVQSAREEGMLPQNDVLKVQVKMDEAELQLRQAENGMRLSRMNLCQVMGLPLDSNITLSGSLDESDVVVDANASIYSRSEYALLNKQIELKSQEVKLVRSDFLPNVGISGGYNYMYGMKLNDELLFNNGSFLGMFSVNIPIFHWGEGRNKIRSANLEKQMAEIQRDEMAEMMNLELAKVLNDYDEATLKVKLMENTLLQADENLRKSRDHYEEGMATLADYLEAQTLWQKASTDLINAKAALRLSYTYYLKAAGKLEIEN